MTDLANPGSEHTQAPLCLLTQALSPSAGRKNILSLNAAWSVPFSRS